MYTSDRASETAFCFQIQNGTRTSMLSSSSQAVPSPGARKDTCVVEMQVPEREGVDAFGAWGVESSVLGPFKAGCMM